MIFRYYLYFIDIFIDIDYGNEDENGDGNNEDDDPYGYNAHFASTNPITRGSRFGSHRRGQHDDPGTSEFYHCFQILLFIFSR
jgi:hypothetical protein